MARHLNEARELGAVGRVDGSGAQGKIVTVNGYVATLHVQDPRDDRGTVKMFAPVLEVEVGLFVGEHANALPHRHASLAVLDAHAVSPTTGPCLGD